MPSLTLSHPVPRLGRVSEGVATMRERVVDAAVRLTGEVGWSQVTMARLAEVVGVSRQTVYNEVGTKQALAEAMVLAELDRFLERVNAGFDAHPDALLPDPGVPVTATEAAVRWRPVLPDASARHALEVARELARR